MNNIFLFDVDNTLTPPRQKISPDMENVFKKFVSNNKVYLVSGSDYDKIVWQLGESIVYSSRGTFGCLGNTYHILGLLDSMNTFPELKNENLLNDISIYLDNSSTPIRTGNHIEKRTGMLNISTIGRNATQEQRKIYSDFDKITNERKKFCDYLEKNYPVLDISIGGEISIDISVKGHGKEQVLKRLKSENKDARIIFFGDRCNSGGNDHGLAKQILLDNGLVFNVESDMDTKIILEKIWNMERWPSG